MKDNKYKVMELFFYVLIVVVGLVLLIMGNVKEPKPPSAATPLALQVSVQSAERWNHHAAIPDRNG